jgi:hypothetical protein
MDFETEQKIGVMLIGALIFSIITISIANKEKCPIVAPPTFTSIKKGFKDLNFASSSHRLAAEAICNFIVSKRNDVKNISSLNDAALMCIMLDNEVSVRIINMINNKRYGWVLSGYSAASNRFTASTIKDARLLVARAYPEESNINDLSDSAIYGLLIKWM